LNLPIHPGNADKEHSFVKNILPAIDKEEHDPSDAVILAAAIKVSADVLTRDKHDLFNTRMENFLRPYGVRILNKIV
jgi:predicted nucleic acid-binding protein